MAIPMTSGQHYRRAPGPGDATRQRLTTVGGGSPHIEAREATPHRTLIVDLNNFATFPTLAIGILVASLRKAGFETQVLSPLACNVPASEREHRETFKDHLARRVHLSNWRPFRVGRDTARGLHAWWIGRPDRRILREVERALDKKPAAVLLSAYLQHFALVSAISKLAKMRGIPVLLGGPMFNVVETAEAWRRIAGLTAIFGSEVDVVLPQIVKAVSAGEDLLRFDGVLLPDGRRSRPAVPLRDLSRVPVPDFSDFPWDRYRLRVIPLMTGRGCQWARCTFCSDVVSANGRTFRTRQLESVLDEMREQSRRYQTSNFLFLDIKLNSNPAMFRGIIENVQRYVPGAQWIGTVHVDLRRDNGLSAPDLRAAASAGMRRISFGLESGSQTLLDSMIKGCTVEANAAFVHHAYEAGLSVRCSMFKGFPGETCEDLELTAAFLEKHGRYIDRIRFNEFTIAGGTPIYNTLRVEPSKYAGLRVLEWKHRVNRAAYINDSSSGKAYRKAKARVLRAVFDINRRDIRTSALAFDGLM